MRPIRQRNQLDHAPDPLPPSAPRRHARPRRRRWPPCRSPAAASRRRPSPGRRPDSFADLAAKLLPAVVNISSTQAVQARAGGPGAGPEMPMFPPGSPFEQFFKDFLNRNRPPGGGGGDDADRRAGAADAEPGLGLHHRPVRPRRDQQPRDRRRRRDHRHPAGQHLAEGQGGRPRRDRRHRVAEGEAGQAAAGGAVRRFRRRRGSATGCWRSATRSASAAR